MKGAPPPPDFNPDALPAAPSTEMGQMKGAPPPPDFNPDALPAAPSTEMAQPVGQAVPMAQPVTSMQSIYPPPNSGQWSTGFCDCCAMVRSPQGVEVGGAGLFCKAWCCLCCVIGDNSEFFGNHEGVTCAGQGNRSSACCMWCAAEVRACVRAEVRACVRACVRAWCVRACVAAAGAAVTKNHEWQHIAPSLVAVPLGCMLHLPIRGAIRRRYGLPENPCCGAFALVCLQEYAVCSSYAQEYRPDDV